jgi:regulator of sirC expression with transglutaminase-like and TPR domain
VTAFADLAAHPAAEPDALLLAAAAEFVPVDARRTERKLDDLAATLLRTLPPGDDAEDQAEALLGVVRGYRLRVAESVSPVNALLPDVIERRVGHPLLLAAICAEAGRRAGIDAAPVEAGNGHLVGVRAGERAVVIDPGGGRPQPPGEVRWLCSHEVTFASLGELSRLYAMHGRIPEAIRAARMRAELPVPARIQAQIDFEANALQAQLN